MSPLWLWKKEKFIFNIEQEDQDPEPVVLWYVCDRPKAALLPPSELKTFQSSRVCFSMLFQQNWRALTIVNPPSQPTPNQLNDNSQRLLLVTLICLSSLAVNCIQVSLVFFTLVFDIIVFLLKMLPHLELQSPIFILCAVPITAAYWWVQHFYRCSSRELQVNLWRFVFKLFHILHMNV